MTKLFATYGRTESGDDIPVLLFDKRPTEDEVHARYRDLLPQEYDDDCPVSYSVDTVDLPADVEEDLRKLRALESAGVDNWSGYDFAMEELWEEDEG